MKYRKTIDEDQYAHTLKNEFSRANKIYIGLFLMLGSWLVAILMELQKIVALLGG